MIRTLWVGIVAVGATLVCATAVIVLTLVARDSRLVEAFIRLWARMIVRAAGIRIAIENGEVLAPDQRYILVANHHSYFDIPCLFSVVPQPIRFMAKESLFRIPLFGWSLRSAGFIPIDRKNRKTAVRSFEMAGERIRRGNTIVIFPEEGRSREWKMRPFQRGAFLLAIKSQLPIVPLAIDGTYQVMPAARLRVKPGPVTIRFGTPIETSGISIRSKEELMSTTRRVIESLLYGDEIPQ
ncbi:MAG TPA: lysophospholipid acyltransferase family protein [Thermoanaerobaculia bacterium]|nr:lysophospholipid acyltransferase family protein [Thermoanaerobaculia bacterium]